MFQTKVVEKITTRILCSITFFRKLCHLWDSVKKKYGTDREAIRHNTARALWLQTHTQNMLHLPPFYCNNGYTKAPRCYVMQHCLSFLFPRASRPVQFFGPPRVLPRAYWCFFFSGGTVVGTLSQSLAFVYYRKLKIREAIPHYRIDLYGMVLKQTQGPKDTARRTCSAMSSTKKSRFKSPETQPMALWWEANINLQ
jgi:hypothetical protein